MMYLKHLSRPKDIAGFLQRAEKDCGYILPNSYLENAVVMALMDGSMMVGGFLYTTQNRLLTPEESDFDAEVSHIWLDETNSLETRTLALKQGIATLSKLNSIPRVEFIFKEGRERENIVDIYPYEKPLEKRIMKRRFKFFSTRWACGNPAWIRLNEMLEIRKQTTLRSSLRIFGFMIGTLMTAPALSVDPDHAWKRMASFARDSYFEVLQDFKSISAATWVLICACLLLAAGASLLYLHDKFSIFLRETVLKNADHQTAAALALGNQDKYTHIPKLQAAHDDEEGSRMRLVK